MLPTPRLTKIAGQPSWRIDSDKIDAYITRTGGHLGPVTFNLSGRTIQPFSIASWAEEKTDPSLPPLLKVLRGDFFCLPFGGNSTPYRGEQYPPHGETANSDWKFQTLERRNHCSTLHLTMDTTIRRGRVDKFVTLIDGHDAIYQRHVVSGMSGPMPLGHHPMLRFPDEPGAGLISTSGFNYGQTFVEPVERPEERGYSFLRPNTEFKSLSKIPTITGETTDLSRYPANRGYEDIISMAAEPEAPYAWTAVSFPKQGYLWFSLKNPRILRNTVFWISNGGRHFPPWNGRHTNVLGLEEVTSYFHLGLKESASPNPWSRRGFETAVQLDPRNPLDVRYIMCVVPIPKTFGRVKEIQPTKRPDQLQITDEKGKKISARANLEFVTAEIDL